MNTHKHPPIPTGHPQALATTCGTHMDTHRAPMEHPGHLPTPT